MGVSLKPSDATVGGFLIDDVDVEITRARFRLWDYNGSIQTPVLGLEVTFREDDGAEVQQVYSAGDTKHFVPSPDGTEAVQVGSMPTLKDSTNAMAFMVSLVNAGFPEDKVGDKVDVFEGTRVHVNQVPQPKRKGLAGGGGESKMILLVSKILSLPWENQKAAAAAAKTLNPGKKAAGAGAPKAAAAAAGAPVNQTAAAAHHGNGEDLSKQAAEALVGILAAKGGQIQKNQIAQEAFKALGSDPNRNQLVQLIYKDEFLKQADAPWTFDGTTVSLGS